MREVLDVSFIRVASPRPKNPYKLSEAIHGVGAQLRGEGLPGYTEGTTAFAVFTGLLGLESRFPYLHVPTL